jgi:nucleotide-binding universal stress UspA family protein
MYRRALVPLDGSQVAESIVPFILEIAGPLDMQVALVRVLVPVPPIAVEGAVVIDDVEKLLADAEAYLAGVAGELRAKGVRVTTMVRRGEPADEILAAARDADADLIAMTTHGRSGLSRLLFGSIAAAVLARAEIPVFLMRQTAAQVRARAAWETIS